MSEYPAHELGEVVVVEPAGRLDALVAGQLDQSLKDALASHARLVVDMAGVTYISSSSLRVLLLGVRRARQQGGDLKLCCLSPRVRQVFALAGFDQVFQLWATRAEALAAFDAPPTRPERVCDGTS